MQRAFRIAVAAFCLCWSANTWAVNHVTIESKSVAPGATGVQIGVYIDNDVELNGLVLSFEFREVTITGGYLANSISADAANRLTTSLFGFVIKSFYPNPDNTNPAFCDGIGYATAGPPDFISPDGFLFSAVNTIDPCLPVGSDGTPPGGTPSLIFTFDVTNADGLILIDTTCIAPANFLTFVDCATTGSVAKTFTPGEITIGNPIFPPVVTAIPDQTIDEGGTFNNIPLDNYVSDRDGSDSELSWVATGQSELTVTISAGRIAGILTPNPDWFGTETITFTATDPDMQSASAEVVFTVNPVNDPPVLAAIGPQSIPAGNLLSFPVTATDVDNESLTLTMENGPTGASFSADGAGNGSFSWSTTCSDEGVYAVRFIASDGPTADTANVTITVQSNPDRFAADPASVDLIFEIGGAPPIPVGLSLTDPGCSELAWTVATSASWLLATPPSGNTPSTITISADTTGLTLSEYDATVTITEQVAPKESGVLRTDKEAQAEIIIPVHLSAVAILCDCPCHADPVCDSVTNVFDVVMSLDVLLRNNPRPWPADCPYARLDVNCDEKKDIIDIIHLVEVTFRERPPESAFCDPCAP